MQPQHRVVTCTLHLPEPEEHNPVIRLTRGEELVECIDTGDPNPRIPLPGGSIHSIDALDVLEHVQDEQIWLAEFARILVPGGTLRLRVPLENPLAWLDALNIYRYVSDTLGAGTKPRESMPLGWHRHYSRGDLDTLLADAGFDTHSFRTEGAVTATVPHLAGLLIGNIVLDRPNAERRLFQRRSRRKPGRLIPQPHAIAAYAIVLAVRVRHGLDPEPDLDPDDRPEQDATTPLE